MNTRTRELVKFSFPSIWFLCLTQDSAGGLSHFCTFLLVSAKALDVLGPFLPSKFVFYIVSVPFCQAAFKLKFERATVTLKSSFTMWIPWIRFIRKQSLKSTILVLQLSSHLLSLPSSEIFTKLTAESRTNVLLGVWWSAHSSNYPPSPSGFKFSVHLNFALKTFNSEAHWKVSVV